MRLRDLVLDRWSPLSHKQPLSTDSRGTQMFAKSYLSGEDRRRLTAYQVLQAYQSNVARAFLDEDADSVSNEHREYGDPALIVKQITSSLLGKDQTILVPGAEEYDPSSATTQGEQAAPEAQAAYERQTWLREWAEAERLPLKLQETESKTVGLGDGVYLLAWSVRKQRPRLQVLDPGFYFPVLPDGLDDDYPTRVHLAWEIPGRDGAPDKLRRVTYELAPIRPDTEPAMDLLSRFRRLLRFDDAGEPVLIAGDQYDERGRIVRRYPWSDEPSAFTCYLTDATWNLQDLPADRELDRLPLSDASFAINEDGELLDQLDLRIDFLPVVHIPNTPATLDHFGESSISPVLQLFDDLAAADTDLQASSATTGSPPIGLAGARLPITADGTPAQITIAPGEVWSLGENGRLHALDTSNALNALRSYRSDLADRVSENARVPPSVLGKVKPSEVPSGITLALSFSPMTTLIRELRLTRGEKYPLLLKFAQRLAMAGGVLEGPELRAELVFGSFLPSDVAEVVKNVRLLLTPPGAISLETAIAMLIEAGMPIDDAAAELTRIQQSDFESANKLADATNDQDAVRERLGLAPKTVEPPQLDLPGVPTPDDA